MLACQSLQTLALHYPSSCPYLRASKVSFLALPSATEALGLIVVALKVDRLRHSRLRP